MSVFEQPLVFVDIETNGLNHVRGRVIEVAAIRVENGEVVKTFNSLIDPETELPYFITNLTGITSGDLNGAPTFSQIADDLHDVLDGAVFVAHNVRFDYSFLKQEYKRLGRNFLPKQLCTVKLSRALYPEERSHKLESLIRRHGFTFASRHRAYDDAAVLWQFLQYVRQNFPAEHVEGAIAKQLRQPAMPKNLEPDIVRDLPETTGVYIFEDQTGSTLYVGKSINIKKRVLSHFGRDHVESKEFKIAQAVKQIRVYETDGELAALLLESRLVKELQPVHNRLLRRLQKLLLVKRAYTPEGYMTIHLEEVEHIDPNEASLILAVYPRRGRAKDSLNDLTKTFDLCPKLMGLEKAKHACFLYQLHKCKGACVGEEAPDAYNERLLTAFEHQRIQDWPFKSAILVQETQGSDISHGIVVDQWCVLGQVSQEPYCEPCVTPAEKTFDLDTYKILQSHIARKMKQLTVTPLTPQQLESLGL